MSSGNLIEETGLERGWPGRSEFPKAIYLKLFHGEKVINLETMVKISKALDTEFELRISPKNQSNGKRSPWLKWIFGYDLPVMFNSWVAGTLFNAYR
ncbi:MAG: hypothetical protein U5K31_02810 [Balneolaceae bacterium]|nr:hypothetical protein [Balneolaceae bacterium]